MAFDLILYTNKSLLLNIAFPLPHYHPTLQQLPQIAKFQTSSNLQKTRFRGRTRFPRKGSNHPLGDRVLGNSDMLFENKRSLRPESCHTAGGAGRTIGEITMPRLWRGDALLHSRGARDNVNVELRTGRGGGHGSSGYKTSLAGLSSHVPGLDV